MPPVAASIADERLQALAVEAANGNAAAFAELYQLSGRRVYGLCRHMLGSPEAAEDATSEVFLKVHRAFQGTGTAALAATAGSGQASGLSSLQTSPGGYNPAHKFLPWLLTIASHFCVDQLRRRGLETRIFATTKYETDEESGIDPSSNWTESWTSQSQPTAEDRLLADAGRDEVRAALGSLGEQYRIPLVLRYDSELSYDEIASTMGLKRNHVATLIFRAKKELRAALRKTHKETTS